jgi:hypothetical protein
VSGHPAWPVMHCCCLQYACRRQVAEQGHAWHLVPLCTSSTGCAQQQGAGCMHASELRQLLLLVRLMHVCCKLLALHMLLAG